MVIFRLFALSLFILPLKVAGLHEKGPGRDVEEELYYDSCRDALLDRW